MRFRTLLLTLLLAFLSSYAAIAEQPLPTTEVQLRNGWQLESSCNTKATGEEISGVRFDSSKWLKTSVPSTVFASQVKAGLFKNPYYGMNLRQVPGETYPVGQNFSNLPMPADSPYRCSWWYRDAFTVPATDKGKTLWLHFGGINYSANVWLNGRKVADSSGIAGAYRIYDLDITRVATPGKVNVVAVETMAPTENNLGINWVDWNPSPPDKDMGLWREVYLRSAGPVTLASPMVVTRFTDDSLRVAELTITAEITNATGQSVAGTVRSSFENLHLEQPFQLGPNQTSTITFAPLHFPSLKVHDPQVWWPADLGAQPLHTLTMEAVVNGARSDARSVRVGLREITSELTDKGYRLFRVNHRPFLVRGGGWSQDMLLRQDPKRLAEDFALVRDMRLNTIRLEGKLETEDFFRLADEKGILVMAGWCCCDYWEHWKDWGPNDLSVATASLRAQMLRLRSHPSLLVWLNGSDNPPPANVESAYLQVEKETQWPNPTLSSASQQPTTVSGQSGVKMTGPYDYVAPSYWYVDTKFGGAYGFNTETSPGPAFPTVNGLLSFLPASDIWPMNPTMAYHAGGGEFKGLKYFDLGMDATYGPAQDVQTYTRIAQTMAYDGERAMFEAYGKNKYTSTGVIQWMLNNAWPSLIWHLYTYNHETDGGYFGTKKALEPLHIQYSYNDQTVWIVNSVYHQHADLVATAEIYDINSKKIFEQSHTATSAPDSSIQVLALPASILSNNEQLHFLRLLLKDSAGNVVSRNSYWIPTKLTQFDWAKTEYNVTPALQPEVMTSLRTLPQAEVTARTGRAADGRLLVHLRNPSKALAFQVATTIEDGAGQTVRPLMWSDNYLELLPGEERTISVALPAAEPENFHLVVSGWNMPELKLPLR